MTLHWDQKGARKYGFGIYSEQRFHRPAEKWGGQVRISMEDKLQGQVLGQLGDRSRNRHGGEDV